MPPPNHNNRTISSVNSGHLTSVICGQPTSVLTIVLHVMSTLGSGELTSRLLKLSNELSALQDRPGSGWKRDGYGEGRRMMLAGTTILYDKCVSFSNVLLQFIERAALAHHTRDFT